jgi:ornithine carbamoyltransferase
MFGGALSGMNVTIVTPPEYEPKEQVLRESRLLAKQTGANINVSHNLMAALKGADVIYTDVWASMGQEADAENRRQFFEPYKVTANVMSAAEADCVVLHCLPAHYGEEIDYEVARSRQSAIFDQAENRLHAQKALMLLLAGR